MRVHLRQIPQGDNLHLEGEEDAGPLGLEEAGAAAAGPLWYSLDVGVSNGGIFATGRLTLDVQLRCVGCLGEFRHSLDLGDFAFQTPLTGAESLDLTPAIREDIHLALPTHPRCDAGSSRKCPAAHSGSLGDVRPCSDRAGSAWDVLDNLKPTAD